MTKYTDNQLQDFIRQAGKGFKLSEAHRSAIRFHILDVINSRPGRINPRHIIHPIRFTMPILVPVVLAVLLALGGGTATLADTAKPGDALYPMDQWMERIQQQLTADPNVKATLYARMADERIEELAELQSIDPSQLSSPPTQTAWQMHQQEAVEHLSRSIEQISAVQDAFRKKLAAATNPAEKAAFQRVLDALEAVQTRRENRLNAMPPHPLPDLPISDLRQQIRQMRKEHQAEMQEIHQNMMQEFDGDETSVSNDNPTSGQTPPASEAAPTSSDSAGQTALIMYVPRDENGNVNWNLIDYDNDGIPDIYQHSPNLRPRFL